MKREDASQDEPTKDAPEQGGGKKGNPKFRTLCLTAAARSRLKSQAVHLLLHLMMTGDADGGNSFKSRRTLCGELGWSEDKLDRYFKVLKEAGWVEAIRFRDRTGRDTSNLYRFRIPPGEEFGPLQGAYRWSKRGL